MRVRPLVFFSALAVSASLLAQQTQDPQPQDSPQQGGSQQETYGHSRHGSTFDEGPRSAAKLMPGLGDQVHFPVAGISEQAQRFFDQGITQQHGFWHFEAERSFRQVAMLHPDSAMAYWGMARANDENRERASGFLCSAVMRSEAATEREQMWIDAWARYYKIGDKVRKELRSGDGKRVEAAVDKLVAANKGLKKKELDKLDKQLLKDLGTIVFEYPEDVEAKAFLAVQNWLAYRWGGGVPIVSHTAVNALLDQVFAKAPLHPAHHYRIHLWDREDARRALDSASKNGSSAPAIAHQWHMPGHIYAKLHRHGEAAWQQEASGRADHAHMMRDGVMPFLIHNYGHNQEWLARSLSHCGRVDEALQIAKNLAELPRHPKHNQIGKGGTIAGYGQKRLVQICEDHGLWKQAIELVEAGFLERSDNVHSEVERLSLLGRSYYRLGRKDEAARVVAQAGQLLAKARARRASAMDEAEEKAFVDRKKRDDLLAAVAEAGRQPTTEVQAVLDLKRELEGERLLAEGDAKAALKELESVRGIAKPLLAGVQVAAGEVDQAIKALDKENKRNPNRVATMGALFRALLARADAADEGGRADAKKRVRKMMLALCDRAPVDYCTEHLGIGVDASPTASKPRPGTPGWVIDAFGDDFGPRPALASIGPRCWSPVANPGFDLAAASREGFISYGNQKARMSLRQDGTRTLAGSQATTGRATLVVFYLGFGCLHCVEQLHALRPLQADFAELGVDIVAIGSDTAPNIWRANEDLPQDQRMPFAMLADKKLEAFRAWRCYDDFEQMPLHGTFLVDAQGRVRWQDISYEPFTEIDWLLAESRRLLALPAPSATTSR